MADERDQGFVVVVRKADFGLPTACPASLPVYIYLRFANLPFQVRYNLIHPDSDQIPYVENGSYVAYNNEKGGVIESLKDDGVVDLDSGLPGHTIPEWLSTKAMITSWLADAVMYELWVGYDKTTAQKVYFSDLPWPIGKILHFKLTREAKQVLGITKVNADRREAEIYRRATIAYEALSTMLGEHNFFLENRPTSLDAIFLGHALFTLHVLPETSILRSKLLQHNNLVRYSENLKSEFLDVDSSSSAVPRPAFDPSSSSAPRKPSSWRTKPETKTKREKTEEEKAFRRKARYFLATQVIAILVFLTIFGGVDAAELEGEDDDDGLQYDD